MVEKLRYCHECAVNSGAVACLANVQGESWHRPIRRFAPFSIPALVSSAGIGSGMAGLQVAIIEHRSSTPLLSCKDDSQVTKAM